MRVTVELANILNATISRHNVYGRYISIENLGILFEPKLKLNFSMLLESYSQNNVLFVRWDGEMYEDNLYFLTKKNGIKINIRNIGHIAI